MKPFEIDEKWLDISYPPGEGERMMEWYKAMFLGIPVPDELRELQTDATLEPSEANGWENRGRSEG